MPKKAHDIKKLHLEQNGRFQESAKYTHIFTPISIIILSKYPVSFV